MEDFAKIISITKSDGTIEPLNVEKWRQEIAWASKGHEAFIVVEDIIQETMKNIFNGIMTNEIDDALILASTGLIERDPGYSYVSARLLLKKLYKEVVRESIVTSNVSDAYKASFVNNIKHAVEQKVYDTQMNSFDLEYLAQHLRPERDELLDYMGLKTLYERYFTKHEGTRLELPQVFFMRVAMGVSLNESNKNEKAVEFYNAFSQFLYVPSTPTLLHSGLVRAQLSSCFLNTVSDDLKHIFKCYGDNAQLSKWSGGIGTDWTNVRATGANIKSIKVESQGLIPFLKIANDTTAAINRSGKRRSAAVVYLETWHLDIEDFIDLRKNTGDERRRTHDINTANWIPDLFMKRVFADDNWTLFSPDEAPDLHHIYGKEFEKRYAEYEKQAQEGVIEKFKVVSAAKLWRKMLSRLFETGHPWITFKDPSNIRSPQDHAGVIHASNLCTEILLNTSEDETAVCNLGSVNLGLHIVDGRLDQGLLQKTISTAMRILDNVIDLNFYPTIEAQNANFKHRPVGLGVMGVQDALYLLDIPFDDPRALEFADTSMEAISYFAIAASSQLAKERGAYGSYKGSKWDRNLFPHDTIELLEQERGMPIEVRRGGMLDWAPVREHVKQYGMRNSNCMAIAPTATISNIVGCFPCIEPIYKNIYVKANMTGEFTVVNRYLIEDLKKLNMWNQDMLNQLKYMDGNVAMIEEIPQHLKDKYKEAFQIDPEWLLQLTAARSKWIDQSQSHNVFMQGVSGKKLSAIYENAWKMGIKTMYYLRTLGASQIEKSTLDAKKFGYTQKRQYTSVDSAMSSDVRQIPATMAEMGKYVDEMPQSPATMANACSILNEEECESCQ
ncbi:MAG TPA: ribonucleoside-diphosphate reductase subunit alpha [Candidatus Babeliales bacterium]|nr:ribonucleoside-diphosphate reductase subunit alpha [Candidatus Babeliales bacterium]